MHFIKTIIITGCVLLLSTAGSVVAQQKTITLEQARQIALERNLTILQAQNNLESTQSTVLTAYGNYLPTLSVSGSWDRTQTDRAASSTQIIGGQPFTLGGTFSVTNNFRSSANLSYTLFDGFSREANLSRATANAVGAEHSTERTRQMIINTVERGYLNVLRTEQLVRVSEENLKRGRRQLERITEQNRVGSVSLADVYRQQSTVATDELNLITAQNNHDNAKADIVALIGLDVGVEYKFVDPTISTELSGEELTATTERYRDVGQLKSRAMESRPDYLSAVENLNSTGSGVTMARSTYFPSVTAAAGYGISSDELKKINDNKSLSWGVRLQWSIFDGFRTNQAIQSAIALERNAEINLAQAERNISVEVKKALLDLDAARKQYEVTQKGLVSAQQDMRIAEERYNLGAGTLLDLLIANANLTNAQANRINASYNFIIAKRGVEYAVGDVRY